MTVSTLLASGCEKKPDPSLRKAPRSKDTVYTPDGRQVKKRVGKHPLYVILETIPRNDYERTLAKLQTRVINPEALQIFCSQWYADTGRAAADAYMAWREKNKVAIKDINDRSVEVWTEYAGPDIEYVRMVYPRLRQDMLKAINNEFDAKPAAYFREICEGYPKEYGSSKWNLEKTYAKELALIRKQPLKPAD